MDLKYLFTSLDGRISRAGFWIGSLILAAVNVVTIGAIVLLLGISHLSVVLTVLVAIALAYPTYALMVKRFQDRNRPGFFAFFPLATLYGVNMLETVGIIAREPKNALHTALSLLALGMSLWILIDLGILRGTQGPNRFGPDPLGDSEADATL
jgi:uncharacterized membrane protein YhaH (DUF805 family)